MQRFQLNIIRTCNITCYHIWPWKWSPLFKGFMTNDIFLFSGNVEEMLWVSILKTRKSLENLPFLDDVVKNTLIHSHCTWKSIPISPRCVTRWQRKRRTYFRPEVETPANWTFVASLFRSLLKFLSSIFLNLFQSWNDLISPLKHKNTAARSTIVANLFSNVASMKAA